MSTLRSVPRLLSVLVVAGLCTLHAVSAGSLVTKFCMEQFGGTASSTVGMQNIVSALVPALLSVVLHYIFGIIPFLNFALSYVIEPIFLSDNLYKNLVTNPMSRTWEVIQPSTNA